MKLLVTGGCGFLGSNIAARALAEGAQLFILDDLSRTGSRENLEWLKSKGKFKFFQCDIRDKMAVNNVLKEIKPDAVFHLAGQVAMTSSISDPIHDLEVNTLGSLNLLEAVRVHCPSASVIYSSTNKVYGDFETVRFEEKEKRYIAPDFPDGFSESMPLDFQSPYGCSKGAADQYMLDYYRIFGIKTVVFRHSSMYGGRQFSSFDQGWIGWFCRQAIKTKNGTLKEPFTISGNGKQVRDVLYADDAVDLYFSSLKNIEKIKGRPFNIGGGMESSLSLLELFDALEKELGVNLRYTSTPWRISDQKIFVADMKAYSKITGWRPKVDKIAGLRKMLEWEKENGKH
jgi:CDP-paratose 2-epimerase